MSTKAIRKALETHLAAMPTVPAIAWENTNVSLSGAFLLPTLLFSEPDDAGYRDAPFIQRGIYTIACEYPTNTGPNAAQAMAEKLRDWFGRGNSFTADSVTVKIDSTPEIGGGGIEDGRYVIRVFVRFWALIDPEAV